ncbi:cellulase family glycosylhydrolase [bacterium]
MILFKNVLRVFFTWLFLMGICMAELPDPPFQKGVNLAGWFQHVNSASEIQFTRFTFKDFENIKSLGCDHIRLPLELFTFTGPAPDHILEPLFFIFLDQAIDWSEGLELQLILDNHSFNPSEDTSQEILDHLIPVWTQIAKRYVDRSNLIYYEILNEPHGISDVKWNGVQQQVIDAIRVIDSNHTIVVGPASWNSYNNLELMPVYSDTNLIYTFHFYDPFLFTHQGASWADPSMETLMDVPFPYDITRMPELPPEFQGTWIGSNYQQYAQQGNEEYVYSLIDIAIQFGEERQVPLWCGEFGAYIPNSHTDDRARWHTTVRSYLEENRIAWSLWEYGGGFGIFEPGSSGQFDTDVNIPIIESLGLIPPQQQEFQLKPDSSGFVIYDDYVRENVVMNLWLGAASANFYYEDNPAFGVFCITWAGADQYNLLNFRFSPIKDLTRLLDENYWLEFWIRGMTDDVQIDIRFVDTDTEDPDDHPWRMRYTIDKRIVDWDGTWQFVEIPLSEFREHGAWEEEWFNPQDDFDWSQVELFEIVAEHHDLKEIDLEFDEIRVTNGSDPSTHVESASIHPGFITLHSIFPNPFNQQTVISYMLSVGDRIQIKVFDVLGREVLSLLDERQEAGMYQIRFDSIGLPSGIYLVDLRVGNYVKRQKMMLLK